MLVIDNVNRAVQDSTQKKVRVRSVDIFFILFFSVLIGTCLYYGFKEEGLFQHAVNGLFLFIFFVLSCSLILFKKLDGSFVSTIVNKTDVETISYNDEKDKDLHFNDLGDLLDMLKYIIIYILSPSGAFIHILVTGVIAFVVMLLVFGVNDFLTNPTPEVTTYTWQVFGLLIPIGVPLFRFLISPS
jgi:hypothetical protein